MFVRAAAVLAASLLCGCIPQQPPSPPPPPALAAASFAAMPGWQDDHVAETLPALLAQCRRLALLSPDTTLGGEGLARIYGGKAGQWAPACAALRAAPVTDQGARALIEARFQPYRIAAPALVTGYYEPQVRGALVRGGIYRIPVLARPADLIETPPPATDPNGRPRMGRIVQGSLQPYWTRQEIEAGKPGKAAQPILFLVSPIDLFFLQIQGAGRVMLPDGRVIRIAFAGSNGRDYTPIGRTLVQRGALPENGVTMQSIRAWLDAHPADAKAVMDSNAHYVFFRMGEDAGESSGPPGAMGVDLVPGRSAAVDRHFTPLASLLFIDTTDPLTHTPWRRLVVAQDLGTNIIGPARVDVFMGAGDTAALRAGQMQQPGTAYLLLPRPRMAGRSA